MTHNRWDPRQEPPRQWKHKSAASRVKNGSNQKGEKMNERAKGISEDWL
jgi:hypothetical protein